MDKAFIQIGNGGVFVCALARHVLRNRNHGEPAWTGHAEQLANSLPVIVDMLQHVVRDDHVEIVVGPIDRGDVGEDVVKLTIQRAKGKGEGNWLLLKKEIIPLGVKDVYDEELDGIVFIKKGGTGVGVKVAVGGAGVGVGGSEPVITMSINDPGEPNTVTVNWLND